MSTNGLSLGNDETWREMEYMSQLLQNLVESIPEQYQDIYGHPEFRGKSSRDCSERGIWVKKIIGEMQERKGKKNLRVLDLGCAQGYYSFVASDLGCTVLGIDMLKENIQVCNCLRDEINASCQFQTNMIDNVVKELKANEYDIIFLFSVVHHISYKNGFDYARNLLVEMTNKSECLLIEMAVKEEPVYWNRNLPDNYNEWFKNIKFYDELDFFGTHLSDVKRPFIFASNKWCEVNGILYNIGTHRNNSYTGHPIDTQKNYYFCENGKYLIKLFRDTELGALNEIHNEIEVLNKLKDLSFVPQIVFCSENEKRILEVQKICFGSLLWNKIVEDEVLNYQTIFNDILDNLIELESNGYYHGDIRTWNICIDGNQRAFLIDFGAIKTTDEDTVAEGQYGFNGVKITTKRAFISLVYDCLISKSYSSIGKYGAYDLSLYYDFERIPRQYATFIKKFLLDENKIESFREIKDLYQSIVIEENTHDFSIEEILQILNCQNKSIYYEKAPFTITTQIDGFSHINAENNRQFIEIAEWVNKTLSNISNAENQIFRDSKRKNEPEGHPMEDQQVVVNVEEIMKEIREAASKYPEEDVPDFNDLEPEIGADDLSDYPEIIAQLRNEVIFLKANEVNPYYSEIEGGIKGFIKRIIRKINKPLIFPLNERQNTYNKHVANVADATLIMGMQYQQQINMLSAQVEELSRELTVCKWRLNTLKNDPKDK